MISVFEWPRSLFRHRIQLFRKGFVLPEHFDAFAERKIGMSFLFVLTADTVQDDPMTHDLFPCKEKGMFRIIYMSRLGAGAVHFDDSKIFSCFELIPALVTNIQAAIIKIGDLPADSID